MKNRSHSHLISHFSLAMALALVVWTPSQAQSAMPANGKPMMESKTAVQKPATKPAKGMMMDGKGMDCHQAMMQQHQALMADIKAQDAELAARVAEMNNAPGDKKLNLLAAIVTHIVEQRTAMNARMGMMQGEVMKCSMQNMPMGRKDKPEHPTMHGMNMDGKMGETKK